MKRNVDGDGKGGGNHYQGNHHQEKLCFTSTQKKISGGATVQKKKGKTPIQGGKPLCGSKEKEGGDQPGRTVAERPLELPEGRKNFKWRRKTKRRPSERKIDQKRGAFHEDREENFQRERRTDPYGRKAHLRNPLK